MKPLTPTLLAGTAAILTYVGVPIVLQAATHDRVGNYWVRNEGEVTKVERNAANRQTRWFVSNETGDVLRRVETVASLRVYGGVKIYEPTADDQELVDRVLQ